MNRIIWAEMQPQMNLAAVDLMLPDLVDEEELLERYTIGRVRDVQDLTKSRKGLSGEQKVAAGVSLVLAGSAALMMPGNAWAAAQIQLSFQLGFSYVGGMLGGPWGAAVGFGIGTVVGGIAAGVWVYGVPIAQMATGAYLIVTGIIDIVTG